MALCRLVGKAACNTFSTLRFPFIVPAIYSLSHLLCVTLSYIFSHHRRGTVFRFLFLTCRIFCISKHIRSVFLSRVGPDRSQWSLFIMVGILRARMGIQLGISQDSTLRMRGTQDIHAWEG